ncbi:MAG: DNA adenine methylase [Dysgonamonadaceae bacterium]|jgi:adenine-specific DNA-methyltransferase|nr:DNA adenine methylase [Dysgonamonadaceae bacterium]
MMHKYPKINFIGNKQKIASWICDHFPSDTETVFDAFSGGCSVAFEAKTRGFEVYTNDILKINYHIANALIKNQNIKLNKKDIDIIFDGEPFNGFMTEHYADVFFFENECQQLDLIRQNIEKLDCEKKKSLAFALMRRAMIRKMPYSRFNINWEKVKQLRNEEWSYEKYKRKRAYHNQSFKEHFLLNLNEYNYAVFDNQKQNQAYNEDIFNLLDKISADVIYFDPPYAGTMNNYFSFYGLLDNFITGEITKPFGNNFRDKQTIEQQFDMLFSRLKNFKYWFLSYNNVSCPTKTGMLSLLNTYSKEVQIVEKEHIYKVTGKENKKRNTEYLFIIKNENYGRNSKL